LDEITHDMVSITKRKQDVLVSRRNNQIFPFITIENFRFSISASVQTLQLP
jgi:hypothetical protein